ncbi:MAG: rRNA maturation RNase YbeY [Pseudanabaenaceae cyanobacterium]
MYIDLYLETEPQIAPFLSETNLDEERWQSWFSAWEQHLIPNQLAAEPWEVSLLLTDDAGIRELNAQYRQMDRPTDVLAFAALEVDAPPVPAEFLAEAEPTCLGDIIISIPTALRQAQEQGHSLSRELAWLGCHGLLHLLGWDHPDDATLEAMLAEQTKMLGLISL